MRAIRAELIKLRRSASLLVVVLLPIAVVVAGAATKLARGELLVDGWNSMWVQSIVFYGLFPLAVGIAIIGSLVWRVEHRGGSWNALMTDARSTASLVLAKAAVVAGLVGAMQVVLLTTIVVVGTVGFGLEGLPPIEHVGTVGLLILATVPLAVLQSTLSMLLRSFAAPVAISLLAAGISVGALMVFGTPAVLLPHALVARTTQLGTGTFADDGSVGLVEIASIGGSALVGAAVLAAVSVAVLDRRDARA